MPGLTEIYELFRTAVSDGGINSRDRIETEARASDDLAITFSAYAALATWGHAGLDLIIRIALDGDTVKSKSAALTLFTMLATSGQVTTDVLIDRAFAASLNQRIDPVTMKGAGRQALRMLVMSLPAEDLLIPLSQSFIQLGMLSPELANELVAALSMKWLRFGPRTLDKYQQMLLQSLHDEPTFQAFFCTFPQLLDPMAMQVWSQPDFHGALQPDFVIRRADDTYLVVEIECPGKPLVTKAGQLSQEATHAEKQALDYENFLSERIAEARVHFPNYRRADCLAVVGLERKLTGEQRHGLDRANGRRQNLKIVGFDWLLERANTILSNIGEGTIEVVAKHRLV